MFGRVDAFPLALFRVAFYAVMVHDMYKIVATGEWESFFVVQNVHFTYPGPFRAVAPLPEPYMSWLPYALGLCAGLSMAGLAFPLASGAWLIG